MDDKLIWIVAANLVGLNFFIVKDWLKGRKEAAVGVNGHCEDHDSCVRQMRDSENCLNHLKREVAAKDAAWEERVSAVQSRLEKGDKKMDDMGKSIQSIDKSMVKLVTIMEERMKPNGASLDRG